MPRGVAGTGRWVTKNGQMVWEEYPTEASGVATKPKTNKYGGPKGTKKDKYGNPLSVHKGKDAGGRVSDKGKVRNGGTVSDEQLEAAAAATKARRDAAAEALRIQREKMLAKVEQRAKKLNNRLKGTLSKIEKERLAALNAATKAQSKMNDAKAKGDAGGMLAADMQIQQANEQLLKLEHKEMTAYGLKRRGEGMSQLEARRAIRNSQAQYSGAALGQDPNPYRQIGPEGKRSIYGFDNKVRDQYRYNYRTKSGEKGHAKSIRRAMITDFALMGQHPEWFDTEEGAEAQAATMFGHFTELDNHAKIVQEEFEQRQDRQAQLQKRFKATKKRYKTTGKAKDLARLNDLVKKYKNLANSKEYKQLIAEVDAIWGKTAIRPDFTVKNQTQLGLYWFYDQGVSHVYGEVGKRQQAIEDTYANALRRRQMEKDMADFRSDMYDLLRGQEQSRYDPLTGKLVTETFDEMLRRVEREGIPPEVLQQQKRSFLEGTTISQRGYETAEDPLLGPFYKKMAEGGIETQDDLKYTDNVTATQKYMGEARNEYMDSWAASEEYMENKPSSALIYDQSRYGENAIGEYFVGEAGDLIYRHVPLPVDRDGKPHPEPLWNSCSLSENEGSMTVCPIESSYEAKGSDADRAYWEAERNKAEERLTAETGMEFRDSLAFDLGPLSVALSAVQTTLSAAVLDFEQTFDARVGLSGSRSERSFTDVEDYKAVADDALGRFKADPNNKDIGVEAGLYEMSNYGVDDDGAFFTYDGQKYRRNDHLPIPVDPFYNGGKPIEPIWFDPHVDAFGAVAPMSAFESPELWYEQAAKNVPPVEKLETARIQNEQRWYEAVHRNFLEGARGYAGDRALVDPNNEEYTLEYHGKVADMPGGGAGLEPKGVAEFLWPALHTVVGSEVIVAKSKQDGRIREEMYFTIDLPVFGRVFETPFAIYAESGEVVEAEIEEDAQRVIDRIHNGEWSIALESANADFLPLKYGDMKDVVNLISEMIVDPTNFVPFLNVAKRGLNGMRAAVSTGKIAKGSFTSKALQAAGDAVGAMRQHPDTFRATGAFAKDAAKMTGMDEREITRFLQNQVLDLVEDTTTEAGWRKAVDAVYDRLLKQNPDVNPQQLHGWVEENLITMLRARGVTVRTDVVEAEDALKRMEASTTRMNAEAVEIDTAAQTRYRHAVEDMKRAEDEARGLERQRAKQVEEVRARAEAGKPRETTARAPEVVDETPKADRPMGGFNDTPEGRALEDEYQKLMDDLEHRIDKIEDGGLRSAEANRWQTKMDDWAKRADSAERRWRARGDAAHPSRAPKRAESVTDANAVSARQARAAKRRGARVNRTLEQPETRYKDRLGKGQHGPRPIDAADLKASIDQSLNEIREAERKLRGQPSLERQAALREVIVDAGSRRDTAAAELARLDEAAKEIEQVKGEVRELVYGKWEWQEVDGSLSWVQVEPGYGGVFEEELEVAIEYLLRNAGFSAEGGLEGFQNYRRAIRKELREASGELHKAEDALSGGKLNPNLNIEKQLDIIRRANKAIALDFEYGRLVLEIETPGSMFDPRVAQTVNEANRVIDLVDELEMSLKVRVATKAERARAAKANPSRRMPYKLPESIQKEYAPVEATGSLDAAVRGNEASMVQRWRQESGVLDPKQFRTDWNGDATLHFPELVPPPGSIVADLDEVRALDSVIYGPDPDAAAVAYHRKALMYMQEWNRHFALTGSTEFPSGYMSWLAGGFLDPKTAEMLARQNRAYRHVKARQRVGADTDRYHMLTHPDTPDVDFRDLRKRDVDLDPEARDVDRMLKEDPEYQFTPTERMGLAGQVDPEKVISYRPGDDLRKAIDDGAGAVWYQPWEAVNPRLAKNSALIAPADTLFGYMHRNLVNVEFTKGLSGKDFEAFLRHLNDGRNQLGWSGQGAHDFRRGTQPLYDMFHKLNEAANQGDVEAWMALSRFHDVVSNMHMAGKATAEMDDFLSTWLMMEARMGLPFSLPLDYAEANFKRMARSRGMMPERAAQMVQHKYKKPKFVGANTELNPSIEPIFAADAGLRGADGVKRPWGAFPPESWLADGKVTIATGDGSVRVDWEDMFHFASEFTDDFGDMVKQTIQFLRANSATSGEWAFGVRRGGTVSKLRAAALERGIHQRIMVGTAVNPNTGRVTFKSQRQAKAMGALYWNWAVVSGKKPMHAVAYSGASRKFILDDHTARILGKAEVTPQEYAAAVKAGQIDDNVKNLMSFERFVQRLHTRAGEHAGAGSYKSSLKGKAKRSSNPAGRSKLTDSDGKFLDYGDSVGTGYDLRSALERGFNHQAGFARIPATSPFEATFHFLAHRAYWTDAAYRSAGIRRADEFLTDMEYFVKVEGYPQEMLDGAKALVRDMFEPEFARHRRLIGDAAQRNMPKRWIKQNVVGEHPLGKLMTKVDATDPDEMIDRAIAESRARSEMLKRENYREVEYESAQDLAMKEDELRESAGLMDEMDQYADLGGGGVPGRIEQLEVRWEAVFESGEAKARETKGIKRASVRSHMKRWDEKNHEPLVPRKPQDHEMTSTKTVLGPAENPKVGQELVHIRLGKVKVTAVDGKMLTLDNGSRVMADADAWETTRTVKVVTGTETPTMRVTRLEMEMKHAEWQRARDAQLREVKRAVKRELKEGPSAEAKRLVGEVVGLVTTPGMTGDAQLRVAKLAAEMARSADLAEPLRKQLVDALRQMPMTVDPANGRPVWPDMGVNMNKRGGPVRKAKGTGDPDAEVAKGGFEGLTPPKHPKRVEYEGLGPDDARTPDDIRKANEAEQERYIHERAEYEAELNKRMEERVAGEDVGMLSGEFAARVANDKTIAARYLKAMKEHEAITTDVLHSVTPEEFTDAMRYAESKLGWDKMPTEAEVEAAAVKRFGENPTDDQFHAMRNEMVAEVKAQNQEVFDVAAARLNETVEARLARDGDEVPLPEEPRPDEYADVGDEGVEVAIDAATAAADPHITGKMVWESLGMSEESYYQTLIRRNRWEMKARKTTKARYQELAQHNDNLVLALRAVRRQKKKKTYRPALRKMQDAFEGANKVRGDIEGIIPDKKMGYYATTKDGMVTEHARSLHARSARAKDAGRVQGQGLPDHVMEAFDPEVWRSLTEHVRIRLRGSRARRDASLDLGRRADGESEIDDILRTQRDSNPETRRIIQDAINEFCDAKGVPRWNIELYWRVRTLVRHSEGRMRRGMAFLETTGGDMDAFMNLRRAAADAEAVEQVKWWLYNNPMATPEEAAEYFRLTQQTSGVVQDVSETLTEADITILDGMFQHLTGVDDINDAEKVRGALAANDTLPPMDSHMSMHDHRVRTGDWSPRTADEVKVKGAWPLDEEIAYWRQNYGVQPAWTSDPRIRDGSAFHNRETMHAVMVETGSLDDQARISRQLRGEKTIDIEAYAHGDEATGVKKKRDFTTERQWAIERYGDRVYDRSTGKMTAMPWLMTPDELIEYSAKHGSVPGLLSDPAAIRAANEAIKDVSRQFVEYFMDVADVMPGEKIALSSGDIHMLAFNAVQRLMISTPWRGVADKANVANALNIWGGIFTGLVTMNPAFTISNAIDTPTKGLLFGLSEKYAKHGYSQDAVDAIPSIAALGRGDKSQFFYGNTSRGMVERVKNPYGKADFVGGVWDIVSHGLAKTVLQPVQDATELRLARQLYAGYKEEFLPGLLDGSLTNGIKLTPEQADLILKRRVVERLEALFPSLSNAGKPWQILNKLLPFISYNTKNKLLWTGWVLDHPYVIPILQQLQASVTEFNNDWWEEKFPGLTLPEHLAHQIPIGFTGMFLDIGMFTDAARGAEWLTSGGDGYTVEDFIRYWLRPLPVQETLAVNLLYDVTDKVTGHGWFGRYVWRKVYDENGEWDQTAGPNGNGYEMDYVGPGTAWGERRMDYLRDMLPLQGLVETLENWVVDGRPPEYGILEVIGNVVTFNEFGHVSESSMLAWQYYTLADRSQELAAQWLLNTPEGQRLTELWRQEHFDPDAPGKPMWTHGYLNDYMSIFYKENEDGEWEFQAPTSNEMRARWLRMQSPMLADLVREGNRSLFALWDGFDQVMDGLDPWDDEARQRLWALRRAAEMGLYQQYPEVTQYYAFGQSREEFYRNQARSKIDEQRTRFYRMFDFDDRPEGDAGLAWDARREEYLRANPEFAATLADEYSQWQASLNRTQRSRDLAISNAEGAQRIQDWARRQGREGLAQAAGTLMDYNSRAFNMESAGYDANGNFKFKADSGWSRYLKGDDPRKVWYADAMRGVGERAVDDKGNFDTRKWWSIVNRNPELRAEYLEREGIGLDEWQTKGNLYAFHSKWSKYADAGKWDKAWDLYEGLDAKTKDYWQEQNPRSFRERLRSYEYNSAMAKWVAYFDRGDSRGAMRYFNSLPKWMRDRYYENNPGKQLSEGQNFGYISMLNDMFGQIDAGNWDAAERIWNSAPSWMRSQYYANNPSSTLFRGGKRGGGGISDAKFRQYTKSMGKWVDLLRDGKDDAASKYFNGLPQWMKDFYFQNNPDKKWQMQEDRMLSLASEYFVADKATQRKMLERNPGLARWLREQNVSGMRAEAIRYGYEKLPDDPWLKRVYREKYPEVFGKEAAGQRRIDQTMDIINKFPFIADEWMKQYEGIVKSMNEALKYIKPRPRQLEQDYSRMQQPSRGMSAEYLSKRGEELNQRMPRYTPRTPRIS